MIGTNNIKTLALSFKDEITAIRRHFHANPELSLNEFKTADFICKTLDEWKIAYRRGIAKTGIEVLLLGKNPTKKVIALRVDMDALPILEKNTVPYKSKNEGVMHACGHDVHMASLLGTLKILNSLKGEWEGTIKFIFQPSEEKLPGGASLMIREGILKNPEPSGIIAQHVFPSLQAGKVGFRSGQYMASCDELFITVTGKGGHAAMPADYNNPLFIAAKLLVRYEELIQSFKQQPIPSVLSVGKIIGNGATNVVPDEVKMEGTFRTLDEKWRKQVHEKIWAIAEKIEIETKSKILVEIDVGYPSLLNDAPLTNRAKTFAEEYLGKENVVELELRMTSEDFSYYSQVIPGCFYRLGTRNEERGITSAVHTPTFDIDEDALVTGSGLMSWIAVQELGV